MYYFFQTNGLYSACCAVSLKNWAQAVYSFLVRYVRKMTYLANVTAGREKESVGNLFGAYCILQVKLNFTLLNINICVAYNYSNM